MSLHSIMCRWTCGNVFHLNQQAEEPVQSLEWHEFSWPTVHVHTYVEVTCFFLSETLMLCICVVGERSEPTNAGIFYPPGTVHTVMFYVILNVHKTRSEYCIYYSCSLAKQCVTFLQLLPQSVILLCLLHYILQSVSGGDIVGDRNGWFRTEYAAGTYHPRHIPEVYMCRCTV